MVWDDSPLERIDCIKGYAVTNPDLMTRVEFTTSKYEALQIAINMKNNSKYPKHVIIREALQWVYKTRQTSIEYLESIDEDQT